MKIDVKDILKKAGFKELPNWCKVAKFTHHSPSQINKPDDRWVYEYLFLTPKQRSELPNNAKMEAGAIIGQAANRIFANKIYDRNKKQYFENK